MTKEELFFKENYPEYVTEKGECLSPYWDLFSAGVICATFELNNEIAELEKENAELKDKLNNLSSVAAVRLANWQKYSKKLAEAKELLREIIDTPVFYQMGGEAYENELYTELVTEAEQFLKECE